MKGRCRIGGAFDRWICGSFRLIQLHLLGPDRKDVVCDLVISAFYGPTRRRQGDAAAIGKTANARDGDAGGTCGAQERRPLAGRDRQYELVVVAAPRWRPRPRTETCFSTALAMLTTNSPDTAYNHPEYPARLQDCCTLTVTMEYSS